MPRSRNIKPSAMADEVLGAKSPTVRLLDIYLSMLADREGRLEDRPERIRGEAFSYEKELDMDGLLTELVDAKRIVRYQIEDLHLIQLLHFSKEQNPHSTERDSELPDRNGYLKIWKRVATGHIEKSKQYKLKKYMPDRHTADTCYPHGFQKVDNTLIPDVWIPDVWIPDVWIPEASPTPGVDNSSWFISATLAKAGIRFVNTQDLFFCSLVAKNSNLNFWSEAASLSKESGKTTFAHVLAIADEMLTAASQNASHQALKLVPSHQKDGPKWTDRARLLGLEQGPNELFPEFVTRILQSEKVANAH